VNGLQSPGHAIAEPALASPAKRPVDEPLLMRDLAQMVGETILNIPGLMEASHDQGFDSILRGGSPERSNTRVPSSAEFDVRRQAGIDQTLGIGDRPFVELSDPGRERLDVGVQFGVGQRAIHIAVSFGLFPCEVFRAQEYL